MKQVVSIHNMKNGKGKNWTKAEIEAREKATNKMKRDETNIKMPNWLTGETVTVWKKTLNEMKEFEILDNVDADLLAAYCDSVVKYQNCNKQIMEFTILNDKGNLVENPLVKIAQSYMKLMLQYSDKLGLNANARARMAKKLADEDLNKDETDMFGS